MRPGEAEELRRRLDELESQSAFQDDLIGRLNDVVSRQAREIDDLKARLAELIRRVAELPAGEAPADDGPPPQY